MSYPNMVDMQEEYAHGIEEAESDQQKAREELKVAREELQVLRDSIKEGRWKLVSPGGTGAVYEVVNDADKTAAVTDAVRRAAATEGEIYRVLRVQGHRLEILQTEYHRDGVTDADYRQILVEVQAVRVNIWRYGGGHTVYPTGPGGVPLPWVTGGGAGAAGGGGGAGVAGVPGQFALRL